jgi:hypothetical protein
LVTPTRAQERASGDWSSHNFDLHNTRFSPLEQIDTSNASALAQLWSIEAGGVDAITQVTPLVVDGVMYYNAGSKLVAVNAATGASLSTYEIDPPFPGVGRGPMVASTHTAGPTDGPFSTPSIPRRDSLFNPSAARGDSSSLMKPSSSSIRRKTP